MTICIAAACDDSKALVLAADAMWTNRALSIEFEHPLEKMTVLAPGCVALTAGDALVHVELFRSVKSEIEQRSLGVGGIADLIKSKYRELRGKAIQERVLARSGFDNIEHFHRQQSVLLPDLVLGIQQRIDDYNLGLEVILAGMDGPLTHIYGIGNPGTSACFDAIGFHTIGSGLPHAATSLIGRDCSQFTSLKECLLFVYEAKKRAEKAPGVGTKTSLMIIRDAGERRFRPEEIKSLSDSYEKWCKNDIDWEVLIDELLEARDSLGER